VPVLAGRGGRERVQPGVDELGGPADVGGHGLVNLCGGAGAVQVSRQGLELDAPQAEQGDGRDLRLRVLRAQAGAFGQDLGGHGGELVHHVALMSPQ
jgi:hypothetical protein